MFTVCREYCKSVDTFFGSLNIDTSICWFLVCIPPTVTRHVCILQPVSRGHIDWHSGGRERLLKDFYPVRQESHSNSMSEDSNPVKDWESSLSELAEESQSDDEHEQMFETPPFVG